MQTKVRHGKNSLISILMHYSFLMTLYYYKYYYCTTFTLPLSGNLLGSTAGQTSVKPRSNFGQTIRVLRSENNRAEWPTGDRSSATGIPFQAHGPATKNTRSCRIADGVREPVGLTLFAQKCAMKYDAE